MSDEVANLILVAREACKLGFPVLRDIDQDQSTIALEQALVDLDQLCNEIDPEKIYSYKMSKNNEHY